jgi:hypothetical protein
VNFRKRITHESFSKRESIREAVAGKGYIRDRPEPVFPDPLGSRSKRSVHLPGASPEARTGNEDDNLLNKREGN